MVENGLLLISGSFLAGHFTGKKYSPVKLITLMSCVLFVLFMDSSKVADILLQIYLSMVLDNFFLAGALSKHARFLLHALVFYRCTSTSRMCTTTQMLLQNFRYCYLFHCLCSQMWLGFPVDLLCSGMLRKYLDSGQLIYSAQT
ncbi:hypothetical protein ABZP36_008088 [Zizania latifolia]